ncbi:hypothetical protein BIW11_03779 [Tropilaelaps mercedesae]|uniref:Uncharacterized protein n=1 Tax=Tropilaelaps mercedesae TaxID=418985 RepID=A0A1V9XFV1_9ACAR|nr:hypothetical protein BIW11_03779 [Tropilaelaps mercedesae]
MRSSVSTFEAQQPVNKQKLFAIYHSCLLLREALSGRIKINSTLIKKPCVQCSVRR